MLRDIDEVDEGMRLAGQAIGVQGGEDAHVLAEGGSEAGQRQQVQSKIWDLAAISELQRRVDREE